MGNRATVGAGCFLFVLTLGAAHSNAVVINFDVDANGNPLTVPGSFSQTQPLRNEYSSLGVTFSGPGPLDGGAILNQSANFGVNARSTPNFLAFNRIATMANGGLARDPETLTFSGPVSSVSIWASGGGNPTSFRMEAFTSGGIGVGSSTVGSPGGGYAQLSIPNPTQPIGRITLTEIGGDGSFVYDDLEFAFIPEPASIGAVLVAGSLLLRRRR
jgi:hypothetical protein